jgi:hypothetical protein
MISKFKGSKSEHFQIPRANLMHRYQREMEILYKFN